MTQERVLIVEDEANERTGLAELVSGWGYRTETAADGVEALDKVASFAPSIVITDVKMPRMGGMELVERLSELSQSIAVVMVTAQKNDRKRLPRRPSGRAGLHREADRFSPPALDPYQHRRDPEYARWKTRRCAAVCATRGPSARSVGSSAPMQEIFHLIEQVAPSTASV